MKWFRKFRLKPVVTFRFYTGINNNIIRFMTQNMLRTDQGRFWAAFDAYNMLQATKDTIGKTWLLFKRRFRLGLYFKRHCRRAKIYSISVLVTSLFVTLVLSDWMPPSRPAVPLEVWSELNSITENSRSKSRTGRSVFHSRWLSTRPNVSICL